MGTYAECIGRYELSLPEAVDFAVTAPEALLKESPHLIRFTDGEEAPHSVLSYEGVFRITSQVPQSRFDKRAKALRMKIALPDAKISEGNERLELYDLRHADLIGWKGQEAAGFESYQGGH